MSSIITRGFGSLAGARTTEVIVPIEVEIEADPVDVEIEVDQPIEVIVEVLDE